MVLSRRERHIGMLTLVVLAILVVDRFVTAPVAEKMAAMAAEKEALLREFEAAGVLFDRSRQLTPAWRNMQGAGLDLDTAAMESKVLHSVRQWSRESRFSLSSITPESVEERGEMREVTFQASGTGPMEAVAGFLWRLESSPLPVRVADLQIGTRSESTGDLSLQLRISALCRGEGAAKEGD